MLTKFKFFLSAFVIPNWLFLVSKPTTKKILYITFDDGPVPEVITPLLALLSKYHVQATFFIIGSKGREHPELLKKIYKAHHTLANHSYSHPSFHQISYKEKCQEIEKTNQIISEITGKHCTLFRSPQGRWDIKLIWYLFKKNITPTHWSRDSIDFMKEAVNSIINRFKLQPVKSGDIILFHDDANLCIEVLTILIPLWQSQGFVFKAIKES